MFEVHQEAIRIVRSADPTTPAGDLAATLVGKVPPKDLRAVTQFLAREYMYKVLSENRFRRAPTFEWVDDPAPQQQKTQPKKRSGKHYHSHKHEVARAVIREWLERNWTAADGSSKALGDFTLADAVAKVNYYRAGEERLGYRRRWMEDGIKRLKNHGVDRFRDLPDAELDEWGRLENGGMTVDMVEGV